MHIDHVQLSGPPGCETAMRAFWTRLGFVEIPKPKTLVSRGGCWFRNESAEIHIGIETPFSPAYKSHPGLAVADLDLISMLLMEAGVDPVWDDLWPGRRRFYAMDPAGNRLEFLEERA